MSLCRGGHRLRAFETFRDAAVDILLRERFAGRAEDDDFIDLRLERRFETAHIWRER